MRHMSKAAVLAAVIFAGAIGTAPEAHASRAQAGPWCGLVPAYSGFDCSFYSLEQCMAFARGSGLVCAPNPAASEERPPSRKRVRSWR